MVSRNTTLVPSLGLRIGPACEAGLSAGMRREHVPPQRRKTERMYCTLLSGPDLRLYMWVSLDPKPDALTSSSGRRFS